MKKLQKSDLKEGEIYVSNPSYSNSNPYEFLNKHSLSGRGYGLNLKSKNDFKPDWYLSYNNMREATPEEKHWLETCIKANEFVSYEEAMETFIPEYVEWINNIGSYNLGYQTQYTFEKNKIFKTDTELPLAGFQTENWLKHLTVYPNNYKPSTKEAYDAQFVVKEPEFVLPEKWCIATSDLSEIQLKKLSNYLNNLNNRPMYIVSEIKQWAYIGSEKGSHLLSSTLNSLISNYNYTLINFEQFEKYVLKEEIPKVVAVEECKSKFIDKNTVETSEGSIFVVGDYVTPFESNSPNKGKKFKITGFRWNNAKTEICAITDLHKPNGIGVDKLELYVETFKLPEKWAIKVNLQNVNIVGKWFNENSNTGNNDYNKTTVDKSRPVYNILHFPAFDYLGMLRHGDINSKVEYNYTEITFEQFKKYVLKEENKPVLTENLTLPKNLCVEVPIPVKEESLLDKAKRLYPVGTKYKEFRGIVYTVNNQTFSQPEKNKIYGEYDKGCLFIYDEWAEIIEYPHDFKVGDKIQLKNSEQKITHIINKIEGNVLFYEANNDYLTNHCRVLVKNAVKVK